MFILQAELVIDQGVSHTDIPTIMSVSNSRQTWSRGMIFASHNLSDCERSWVQFPQCPVFSFAFCICRTRFFDPRRQGKGSRAGVGMLGLG